MAAKLNAHRSQSKVKGGCPVRAQRVCLCLPAPLGLSLAPVRVFDCRCKELTKAPDTIICPSVRHSLTDLSEQAAAGRYILYDRCSYREPSQYFSQKFLRFSCTEPVYYAHGRIINFFIFWRRNARSHTKCPISDRIIGTSVFIDCSRTVGGWLAEGFGAGLGF